MRLTPCNDDFLLNDALVLLASSSLEQAARRFEELSGSPVAAVRNCALVYLIITLIEKGDLQAAEKVLAPECWNSRADSHNSIQGANSIKGADSFHLLLKLLATLIACRRGKSTKPFSRLRVLRSRMIQQGDSLLSCLANEVSGRALIWAAKFSLNSGTKLRQAVQLLSSAHKYWDAANRTVSAYLTFLPLMRAMLAQSPDLKTLQAMQEGGRAYEGEIQELFEAECLLARHELAGSAWLGKPGKSAQFGETAGQCLDQARAYFSGVSNAAGIARIDFQNGKWLAANGQAQGLKFIERAREEFRRAGMNYACFDCESALADIFLEHGDVALSLRWRGAALETARAIGDFACQAAVTMAWADACTRRGDFEAALQHCKQVRDLSAVPKMQFLAGMQLANLACLMNDSKQAMELCANLSLMVRAADRALKSQVYYLYGAVCAAGNQWPAALEWWRRSQRLEQRAKNTVAVCERRSCIAQAIAMSHYQGPDKPLPRDVFKRAVAACELNLRELGAGKTLRARSIFAGTVQVLGQITLTFGSSLESLRLFATAEQKYSEIGFPIEAANCATMQGLVCRLLESRGHRGMEKEAVWHFSRAEQVFNAAQMVEMTKKVRILKQQSSRDLVQKSGAQSFAH